MCLCLREIQENPLNRFLNPKHNHLFSDHQELAWHYFFESIDRSNLNKIVTLLEPKGFSCCAIYTLENPTKYILQLKKIEIHCKITLKTRNRLFTKLAIQLDLTQYLGVDVYPLKKTNAVLSYLGRLLGTR